jgi:hypothetical protein
MEQKDYILITLSGLALTISIISLIITLIQKNKETKRTIRKNITDNLESISKANIEFNKLKGQKDTDFNSEVNILIRRNINSQKRAVLSNAQYLIDRYSNIATESDYNILAGAYKDIGDQALADKYFKLSVNKANSPEILIMNLRGYGNYKFANNEIELGRELYYQATQIELTETDEHCALKCDTYIMFADHERNIDKVNFETCLTNAMELLSKIKNEHRKNEMLERIRRRLAK